VREPLAVAEGRVLVLRLDGMAAPIDPEEPADVRELERLSLALDHLDALDASGTTGCWRSVIAGRA
jgi:hypothetical protein